jgi:hypothetical protein
MNVNIFAYVLNTRQHSSVSRKKSQLGRLGNKQTCKDVGLRYAAPNLQLLLHVIASVTK